MAEQKQDPRFRRFRVATLAVYLVLVVTVSGFVTVSVVRSVLAMSPKAVERGETAPVSVCAERLKALFNELEVQHQNLGSPMQVVNSDKRWSQYRLEFLTRSKQLEAVCDLNDPSRSNLKKAFAQLDHVLDLFTVEAVQFAGEVGPSLDAMRELLRAL